MFLSLYLVLSLSSFISSSAYSRGGSKYIVSEGVLAFLLASNNSDSLGTPKVTFLSPVTPDLWNVFNVIYVVGSPIDWAAIAPTASPG